MTERRFRYLERRLLAAMRKDVMDYKESVTGRRPTTVVNLRYDDYDDYIGRSGKGRDGYFGNPTYIDAVTTRTKALAEFMVYFDKRIAEDADYRRRVLALRGKRLGCFCAPRGGLTAADHPHICHGQIMAEWIDAQPE